MTIHIPLPCPFNRIFFIQILAANPITASRISFAIYNGFQFSIHSIIILCYSFIPNCNSLTIK